MITSFIEVFDTNNGIEIIKKCKRRTRYLYLSSSDRESSHEELDQ